MTYKTHLAAGLTASLLLIPPSDISGLILCLGVSSVGSVISDVDATSSERRKNLGKVSFITAAAIIAVTAADHFTGSDIAGMFRSNAAVMRLVTGFLLFLGVCVFGEHQPHRSFMHSVTGTAAVSLCTWLILPEAAVYMAVSMLSHIALDTLNKKKIQILYPIKKPRIGLNLCYADGAANKLIFLAASAADVILVYLSIRRLIP